MKNRILPALVLMFLFTSCVSSKHQVSPTQKIAPAILQEDYRVFRGILEHYHPGLYWFTPKEKFDQYFDEGFSKLSDSLTETEFRNILQYVSNNIHCGHTAVQASKKYNRYIDTARLNLFPLSLKVWPDSMAVIASLDRKDSVLRRGTVIKSINGITTKQFTDTFFHYVITDGNALNGKYQSLSSRGSFGTLYKNVLGLPKNFDIIYVDRSGNEKHTQLPVFTPVRDTSTVRPPREITTPRNQPREVFVNAARNIQIDTTLSSAYMTLNTFAKGNKLRPFFNESFRTIRENNIQNLVIDVRANGGGDAGLSTMLTQLIIDKKFKLADSLYAVHRSGPYNRYIKKHFFYRLGMLFITHKAKDGNYHFGYFERHYFKPRKKNHFNGNVYIIIGGNSFSATTIFAKALQHQKNVIIVGEETGGGSYGNNAWMIPDVVLPNTGVRFRLPLFRLVMDKEAVASARGIIPDIEVAPTAETIRKGIDPKAEKVKELILSKKK